MILSPSTKTLLTIFASSFNLDRIKPSKAANIMIGSMSPLASELIGLSGIAFKRVLVIDWLIVTFDGATSVKVKPVPG